MLVKSPALVSLLLDATFVAGLHMERPGEKEALFDFESSQDPQSEAEAQLAAANKQQNEDRVKLAKGKRDAVPPHVKAGIQADAAECFLQLALFDAGKERFDTDTAVLTALRTLSETAETEAAKKSAHGALMALEPRQRTLEADADAEAPSLQHIMVSCALPAAELRSVPRAERLSLRYVPHIDQWDVQPIIRRIVGTLRLKDYKVWLDLDQMK